MNAPVSASAAERATPVFPKLATDEDRLVGLRITALRKSRGVSQTDLGTAVGVTFQQIQKYEKGQNRVGAGRLQAIARYFAVPVSTFYEEEGADGSVASVFGFMGTPGALELVQAYGAIACPEMRRHVLALVRCAAKLASPGEAAAEDAA